MPELLVAVGAGSYADGLGAVHYNGFADGLLWYCI